MSASSEFSDQFSRLLKELSATLDGVKLPNISQNTSFGQSISPSEFRRFLGLSAGGRSVLSALPRSIEIGDAIEGHMITLLAAAQDGKARGCVGFILPTNHRLFIGNTVTGDREGVMYDTTPPKDAQAGSTAAFTLHAHTAEHFSPRDFAQIVNRPINAAVLTTHGNSLMVVKTSRTPSPLSAADAQAQITELYKRVRANFAAHEVPKIFTKVACVQYSLGLYLSRSSDRSRFLEVKLPNL